MTPTPPPTPNPDVAAVRPLAEQAHTDADWITWAQDVTGVYVTTVDEAREQVAGIVAEYARFANDVLGAEGADGSVSTTEWGVVIDSLGSADMAESEAEAREWLAAGQGLSLVRVVVTEWPRVNDPDRALSPGVPS